MTICFFAVALSAVCLILVRSLWKKISAFSVQAHKNESAIDEANQKIQQLISSIDLLRGTFQVHHTAIDSLQSEQQILQKDLSNLSEELVSHEDKVEELHAEMGLRMNRQISDVLQKTKEEFSSSEKASIAREAEINNAFSANLLTLSNSIQELFSSAEKKHAEDFALVSSILEDLSRENQALQADNEKLKKNLEFYTEIKSDSTLLNSKPEDESRNQLLDQLASTSPDIQVSDDNEIETSVVHPVSPPIIQDENVQHELEPFDPAGITNSRSSLPPADSILDQEQNSALQLMETTSNNLFITGKAGCGKSFLLEAFVRRRTKKVLKLAPTGIAALNIDGATLHSAFGYQNLEYIDYGKMSRSTVHLKSEKWMVLKHVEAIIIDEISMVRADTFDKISRILQIICQNDLPFGGKQIIVFGDLFQLPPVAKRDEQKILSDRYGGTHFFLSEAYRNGNFTFIELKHNHRQEGDNEFFQILNRMREGSLTKYDFDVLNSRVITDAPELRRIITLFPTKREVEKVNKNELSQIPGKEYTYVADITLDDRANKTRNLENIFPITDELKLKVGCLVMMVANDPSRRWVNGTLGIIEKLEEDRIFVTIDAVTFEVTRAEFTEKEAVYSEGSIEYKEIFSVSQFPIVLAYAITIHKSQGMTYQRIACDISASFTFGQTYVAFSRCKSLNGLYLKRPLKPNSIKVDKTVLEFYQSQIISENGET